MKSDIDMVISHDGQKWVARNGSIEASGNTLNELDENTKKELIKTNQFKNKSKVVVFMGTDRKTVPEWMRPYQSHYFNRFITFNFTKN